MNKRYHELDSLRGIAALIVVIHHFLLSVPIFYDDTYSKAGFWLINLIKYTPLSIIWAGHESVVVFFVLSGFVLSLPFFNHKPNYSSFLIKRICRIYIPYIIAVLFAISAYLLFAKGGIDGMSINFNMLWVSHLTPSLILNHFLLLGEFDTYAFDPVIWSLIHEMRISIIFPILMLFIVRFNWGMNAIFAFAFTIASYLLARIYHPTSDTSIVFTFYFTSMFIVGTMLAKYRSEIVIFFKKLSTLTRFIIFLFGILCYTYTWWALHGNNHLHGRYIDEWATTIGASIFIISTLTSKLLANILLKSPIQFIGKISYSLYLYHIVIYFSATYILHGLIPLWLIWLVSLPVTFLVSTLSWYIVEKPSMRLGKKLSEKIQSYKISDENQITFKDQAL